MVEKYPTANACNLNIQEQIIITKVKETGNLKITNVVTEERMYITDKASSAVKEHVNYSSFYDLKKLEAATYAPKGKGYKKVKVNNFKTNSNTSGNTFHDDSKERVFYFTDISKGAKTYMKYTIEVMKPEFIPMFFFQGYYPTENVSYSIKCPKDVVIDYKLFNVDDDDIEYTKISEGLSNVHTWKMKDLPKIEYETDGPNPRYYAPQIHPFIVSYENNFKKVDVLGSPEKLHKFYRNLIDGYNTPEAKDVTKYKGFVDSLTADADTELEKVEMIYNWVQTNIKYIAFEYELGGFVPRPANLVCSRKFGDCKDMANTIKFLLSLANIKSYLTWIGTTSIPYKYSEISTPSVDNHMIATYIDKEGNPYFLDATNSYLPFGEIASHIQGKQAMVSFSYDSFQLMEVPIPPASFTTYHNTSNLSIDGKNLIGTGTLVETGYYKNTGTYRLSAMDEDEKLRYFKSKLQLGSNNFFLEDYKLRNLGDQDKPLEVDYSFNIENYVSSYEDELYIDMSLYKRVGTKIKDDRELPFEYNSKFTLRQNYVLEIPEGYKVTYMPKDYSSVIAGGSNHITMKVENNKIYYEYFQEQVGLLFEKKDFETWNTEFQKILDYFSESVVLKKIN